MTENKMLITVVDKTERKNFVSTTKEPLAIRMECHVNTVHNMFNKAKSNGGIYENERYIFIVSWEYIKANRGRNLNQ